MLKKAMPQIAANEKLRRRLCDDIMANKLSHAYIIEGAPGTGRHMLARSIALSLACLNKDQDDFPLPCFKCEACRKIESNLCPDVITLGKEEGRATIGVETARFIRTDIRTHPNDIDYKIYIIDDADLMTSQAQNALLLTLEEPPSYAVIILICKKADELLETVRSRAPIIRTEPVPEKVMDKFLREHAPEALSSEARRLKETAPDDYAEIITASGGGIGSAYELLEFEKRSEVLAKREQVRKFIETALYSRGSKALLDAISGFPQKRDELTKQIDNIRIALRDLLILKKSETAPLCFYSNRETALELSSVKSANYLLKFISACEEASNALRNNANIKLTTTILATSI